MLASGAKLINCEVTGGRYAGVMMGSNTLVEGCNIHHNARTGIKADYASNGIVRNNDIHHNNPDKAFDPYDEAGGSKFWATTGFIFENNKFRDNIGNGLWLDYDNRDYIIRNNQTSDNTLAGIFVEISYSGLIENNTGTRDGDGYSVSGWGNGAGIVIENSSGTSSKPIVIRNNTTIDCTNGVMIIHVDGRSEETHGGNYETEWIQVTDCDLRNSGKNGWVGDRPSNVTWLHNTLSGNSRLVGGF
jgi:parallel beta-helix repeat protein